MAIGIIKKNTLVALKTETVEGALEPLTDGDDFIQVLEDGLEMVASKELVERAILVPSIGQITPRTSTRGVTGSIPVEWRGAGNVADQTQEPDYFELLDATLGAKNTFAGETSDALGTTTTYELTGTTASVGDFITIEVAGAFHLAFVTEVADPTVTFTPAAAGAIPATTVISPSVTYASANSAQPSLSAYVFWGDEIQEAGVGVRVPSMSVESFTTGQIPSLNFGIEGLTSTRIDGSAPFTPITGSNPPPVVLGAVVSQGGNCIPLNEATVSLENTLSFLTSVCSLDGKISSRYTSRALNGTMNPYMDDTTLTFWDTFEADTPFELIMTVGIPDPANPGELLKGSSVGLFLPNCLLTENSVGDVDLLLVEQLAFIPNAGASGDEVDIYMGFC